MSGRRQTFRVFEHERLAVGRTQEQPDGTTSRFEHKHFEALSRFADRMETPYFRLGHKSVRFSNYVGLLQVGELGIEVLPKADRTQTDADAPLRWRDVLLEMIRAASGLRLETPSTAPLALARRDLLDIYVEVYIRELELLLRQGLTKKYRETEGNLQTFRGRLRTSEHVRTNAAHHERFFVSYVTYDYVHLLNAILVQALEIVQGLAISPGLLARAKAVGMAMPELHFRSISATDFERIEFSRNTRRYEEAIRLARLLLLGFSPDLRWGCEHVVALFFDMNVLWESFVAKFLRRALDPGFEVRTQVSRALWSSGSGSPRRVRPDAVVRHRDSGRTMVIDTKWKLIGPSGPSISDLRQMFVYNEYFGASESVLLYPDVGTALVRRGRFQEREHHCQVATLDVAGTGTLDRQRLMNDLRTLVETCIGSVT